MISFSIIIPNFNGDKYLGKCLESILSAIKLSKENKYEFIMVDNGSIDNSVNLFSNLLPQNIDSKVILLGKNTGFANAVNQGILAAKHDYVVVTNNDLTLDKNWFKVITTTISQNKEPKIVTFSGLVLNRDGSEIESRGLTFNYRGKCNNIDNDVPFTKNYNLKIKNSFVWGTSAALVVYHRQTIIDIGLFDPKFFAYEEDVDLALRLHNLRFKTLFIPSAVSSHLGGGTSSKMGNLRPRMDVKNWFYIIIKNYTPKEIIQNLLPIIEERFRNLSGLIKLTIRTYGLKSIYKLPIDIVLTYSSVLVNLPRLLSQRRQLKQLKIKYNK